MTVPGHVSTSPKILCCRSSALRQVLAASVKRLASLKALWLTKNLLEPSGAKAPSSETSFGGCVQGACSLKASSRWVA